MENRGSFPITTLDIGYDREHGDAELSVPPMGWRDGHPALESPPGWSATVEAEEDTLLLDIEWGVDTTGVLPGITGGTTLAGFVVSIPRVDEKYSTGHWTAYVNGDPIVYTGKIQRKQSRGK